MTLRISEPIGAQMRYLTTEQKELLIHQRNVEYGRQIDRPAIYDLIALGLFDEAGTDEAQAIKEAIERDDDERCGCVYEFEGHTIDSKGDLKWIGQMVRGKNYLTMRKIWSEKHGGMVHVYRCHMCEHMNAIAGEPHGFHGKINKARSDADSIAAPLLKAQTKRHQVTLTPQNVGSVPDIHQSFK